MTLVLRSVEAASPVAMTVLVIATVVLLAAIVVSRTIMQSAAGKHTVVLVALVTTGLCPFTVTAVRLAGAAHLTSSPNRILYEGLLHRSQSAGSAQIGRHDVSSRRVPFAGILLVLWITGASVSLGRLTRGLQTMTRIRCSGTPLPEMIIAPTRKRLASALGRNVPKVLASTQLGVPVALGGLRPIVLLPSSFPTRLSDEQLFQILMHECAHALRRDTLVGLYQRLLAALLWFHPLIYVANQMLDLAREELCDNYVLQAVGPAEYSRTLLIVAQSLSPMPNGCFAPTLVQSARHLEDRVAGLLNPRRCIMTRLTSKKITAIAASFIVGALALSCFAATPTDEDAVRATITNYIEAYYTGDAARMEKSLHPHYLKHTISGSEGKLRMSEWTGLQMVQDIRSHGPSGLPASERKEEITVLDIAGDVASAKLVTARWVDYMTLSKWNGEWKIVSVVLRQNK